MTQITNFKSKRLYLKRMELHHKLVHSAWAGGVALLIFAAIAVILANLPSTKDSYHHFWNTVITFGFGDFTISKSLEYLINDGLMVIFFFYVGLEIKREIIAGQLSSIKQASLPIAAAIGGMIVPAIIYTLFNFNTSTASGWGIPMATDIAFAIGVLSILGKKVPLSLKVFLTALAIVDDLGAIVVIALFYPSESGIDFTMLLWAIVFFGYLLMLQRFNIYKLRYYLLPAVVLWILFLNSGIHATIAGVLIAMTIPSTPRFSKKYLLYKSKYFLSNFEFKDKKNIEVLGNEQQHKTLQSLRKVVTDSISPSQRLEYALHHFVAFFIMPIFALANAGVTVADSNMQIIGSPEGLGIFFGLVMGKPLGITLFCWIAIKIGLGELPTGANWKSLIGVACLGGIGFTMSIFVTNLAFTGEHAVAHIMSSKVAILLASVAAGILGWVMLMLFSEKPHRNPHYHES